MSIFTDTLKSILTGGGLIGKVLDKVAADKITEAERAQIELEFQKQVDAVLVASEADFRDFFLKYEGEAEKVNPVVQTVRGLVRPLITYYVIALLSWCIWYLFNNVATIPVAQMDILLRVLQLLFWVNMVVLVFWFGDRFLQRTGALDALKDTFGRRGEPK